MFSVYGNPTLNTGWVDSGLGDRRIYLGSGPFTMAVGDTQEVVIATLAAIGTDRLSSVEALKFADRFAQEAFDNLFVLPNAPKTPNLTWSEYDGQIFLNWGFDGATIAETEGLDFKDHVFEGYNVYQLPTSGTGPAEEYRIATFDLINDFTTISQEQFDLTSGQVVSLPTRFGTNSGIARTLTVTQDELRVLNLVNGQTYYFGVSAYSLNPDPSATIKTLESTLAIATVVPQTTKPGQRLTSEVGAELTVEHTAGTSDGTAVPVVVDPANTVNANYEVIFYDVEGDHGLETVWGLVKNGSDTLLADQHNQSGDANYLITEGFQTIVSGPPPGVKTGNMFENADPAEWGWDIPQGTRRFTWANADFGFEGFFGAIGWGSPHSVFGGAAPEVAASDLTPVLLILATVADASGGYDVHAPHDPDDPNVSYGYRFGRGFSAPPALPEFAPFIVNPVGGYSYQDFTKSVPLSAWDVSDPDNPRRLAVGHLENNTAGGLVDGRYFPGAHGDYDNVGGGGPREWLWIYNTDYSETPNPDYQVEAIGNPQPIQYWLTVGNRGGQPWSPNESGEDHFLIVPNFPNTAADIFTFSSTGPSVDATLAKRDVADLVNVFPNPYLGVNQREENRFNRRVTFSHLTAEATIRIFNLAGILVRTIEKNDDTQFANWDLLTDEELPVASGIYIANIDMTLPGSSEHVTKNLKLAIVQEQQFLRSF
jgi:hypothetical protein